MPFALPNLKLRFPLCAPFPCITHTHTHTHTPMCVVLADLRWVLCADEGQPACTVSRSGPRSHREEPRQWWREGGRLGKGVTLSPLPCCWEEGQCSGLFLPCLTSTPGPLDPRQQPRSELGRGHLSPRSQEPGCTALSRPAGQVLGSLGQGQTPAQHADALCYSALPKRVWINNN